MKRALGTHIEQHQSAAEKREIEIFAVVEHAWTEQHHPIRDQTSVMEQARNVDILQVKEAFCSSLAAKEHLLHVNRDWGSHLRELEATSTSNNNNMSTLHGHA